MPAWEISIGSEAWNDIYRALPHIGRYRIINALRTNDPRLTKLVNIPDEELADMLYYQIHDGHRSCSYGGYDIYLDRHGYDMISWDEIDRINEEHEFD